MPYEFSPQGDFRSLSGHDCLILDIEIKGNEDFIFYKVLTWSDKHEDYIEWWIQAKYINYWYVYLETTEKQKRQQKLFQQLGNAHRTLRNLDTIYANSVDVLTVHERERIGLAASTISRNYIPMLKAQMRNLS